MKSFTNLEKIMFSLFEMFCLLFFEVRTALGKLKAQAELKRNNYDKGHETFLYSNQSDLMQILLDSIKYSTTFVD